MAMHADDLRAQARRARRLALTVSSHRDSEALKVLARQYDADAEIAETIEKHDGLSELVRRSVL